LTKQKCCANIVFINKSKGKAMSSINKVVNKESTDGVVIINATVDSLKEEIENLEWRYLMFCEKHNLDDALNPDEQYDLCENQQRWIDNHLNKITSNNVQLFIIEKDVMANPSSPCDRITEDDDISYDGEPIDLYSDKNTEVEFAMELLQ